MFAFFQHSLGGEFMSAGPNSNSIKFVFVLPFEILPRRSFATSKHQEVIFLWFHCDFKSNFLICELNIDWRALFLCANACKWGVVFIHFNSNSITWFFYRLSTDIHQNRNGMMVFAWVYEWYETFWWSIKAFTNENNEMGFHISI